jgi:hypothetical protein
MRYAENEHLVDGAKLLPGLREAGYFAINLCCADHFLKQHFFWPRRIPSHNPMAHNHPDLQPQIQGNRKQIAVIALNRPAKRNALNSALVLILALRDTFQNLPTRHLAAVVHGSDDRFCASLDLSERIERDAAADLMHSRMRHQSRGTLGKGRALVVPVLRGAVLGVGLELATACHHTGGRQICALRCA